MYNAASLLDNTDKRLIHLYTLRDLLYPLILVRGKITPPPTAFGLILLSHAAAVRKQD